MPANPLPPPRGPRAAANISMPRQLLDEIDALAKSRKEERSPLVVKLLGLALEALRTDAVVVSGRAGKDGRR